MRRKEKERDEAFAWKTLDESDFATLSMCDGSVPYAVPVSPARIGKSIYFHCALEGKKLDVLQKNDRVLLSCATGVDPIPQRYTTKYASAMFFGTARLVEDDETKISALRAICEKYAKSNMQGFDDAIERSLARTGVVEITPDEITAKAKEQ